MDVIILAAGRGSRLKGVAPPFHKPLMVVDGKPLVLNAIDLAHASPRNNSVVLVVAPENALPICNLLDDTGNEYERLRVVVQRNSRGPGAAFMAGWEAASKSSEYTQAMLLMADNTFTSSDLNSVKNKAGGGTTVVGGRRVVPGDMTWGTRQRFTRVHGDGYNARFVEGELVEGESQDPFVWCGPLCLNGQELYSELSKIEHHEMIPELKLGRYLGYLTGQVELVEVETRDVGTEADLQPKVVDNTTGVYAVGGTSL